MPSKDRNSSQVFKVNRQEPQKKTKPVFKVSKKYQFERDEENIKQND